MDRAPLRTPSAILDLTLASLEKVENAPTPANPVDFFLVLTFNTLMHSAMSAPELSMTLRRPLRPIILLLRCALKNRKLKKEVYEE